MNRSQRWRPKKARRAVLAATSAGFVVVLSVHAASPGGRRVGASPTTPTSTHSSTSLPSTNSTTVPSATRSAVGASEQFGYGTLSVKVTVRGTTIVGVSLASFQAPESFSQSLESQAVPILTSEVLAAQSANIQAVSGASYTSAGFTQSLQSALSSLGL